MSESIPKPKRGRPVRKLYGASSETTRAIAYERTTKVMLELWHTYDFINEKVCYLPQHKAQMKKLRDLIDLVLAVEDVPDSPQLKSNPPVKRHICDLCKRIPTPQELVEESCKAKMRIIRREVGPHYHSLAASSEVEGFENEELFYDALEQIKRICERELPKRSSPEGGPAE